MSYPGGKGSSGISDLGRSYIAGKEGASHMKARLFTLKRRCVICGAEATGNLRKRNPGELNILSITPILYRRGTGKGQLKNGMSIQICEVDLVRALTSPPFDSKRQKEAALLWAALQGTLSGVYSAMAEADKK